MENDEKELVPAHGGKPKRVHIIDPHHVPTSVVNIVFPTAYFGSLVNLTLGMSQPAFAPDGTIHGETVIVSRLRFDLQTAKLLRDVLSRQIDALAAPTGSKQN